MREKLQSLPVTQLREIAKTNGIKSVTTLRKQQLIDMILEVAQKKEVAQENQKETKKEIKKEVKNKTNEVNEEASKEQNGSESENREQAQDDNRKRRHHRNSEAPAEHKNEVPNENGTERTGILEVMPDGFGFIRCDNYMPEMTMYMLLPLRLKDLDLKQEIS